jgi:beta-galactosidase
VVSTVTIILSPETMLVQSRQDNFKDIPGRMANAHLLSALAFYETLCELGVSPEIKLADDFKWNETKTEHHVAILPNMTCIPGNLVAGLETYIQNKNKLIITGLSGYFDENENNVLLTGFPLQRLVGGTIKEIRLVDKLFFYRMNGLADRLPVHMWETEILPETGTVEGKSGDRVIGLRNQFDGGEVLWIPGMIGLAAWLEDNRPLAALLKKELGKYTGNEISFTDHTPGVFMKVLRSGNGYLIILINGKKEETSVGISGLKYEELELLYGNKNWPENGKIRLEGRGTLVFRLNVSDI